MARPEKVRAVADIKERFEGARAVFLAEYAGLSVKEQQTLRRALKKGGAEFKVVKMSLARRAAAALEIEALEELLLGPTGLAFADEDAVAAAKALREFAKDHEVFIIKGGLLGRDFLTPERVGELADIEPREVLLAKIAGAAKAPLANLAGLMAALPRNLASMLQQVIDGRGGAGEAAAAAEADDAASDEVATPVDEAADGEHPKAATAEDDAATEAGPGSEPVDEGGNTEDEAAPEGDDEPVAAGVAATSADQDDEPDIDAAPAAEEE